MKCKKFLLPILLVIFVHSAHAQKVPYNSEFLKLADRINIIEGEFDDEIFPHSSFVTDYEMAEYLNSAKLNSYEAKLSNADIRDINTYLLRSPNAIISPKIKTQGRSYSSVFYNKSPHLFASQIHGSFISVDPRVQFFLHANNKKKFISSSIGLGINGRFVDRVGLSIAADYYTEQFPDFFAEKVQQTNVIPNAGKFNTNSKMYQYLLLDAQVNVDIIKNGLTASIGQSKHFIGDGIRSLIISDYSTPMPFLSFQTKIGKFHYTNLFVKMENQFTNPDFVSNLPNKYAALHFLSINATPWLNIGLFETVISARTSTPEIGYFNPVIFYRALERSLGTPDKMAIGLTLKVLPLKNTQLYSQFFINEFTAKEFFNNNGYLHNKWGAQVGFKYFNAFNVNNLDLQAELNVVRPYTYQHRTNANFSNYNQALAHPLGAGFREGIVSIGFRPFSKLRMNISGNYYQQGVDTNNATNVGSDILRNIKNNAGLYGVKMINGVPINVLGLQFTASYEYFPSQFLEAGIYHRKQSQKSFIIPEKEESYFYIGVRYNVARRNFMQF